MISNYDSLFERKPILPKVGQHWFEIDTGKEVIFVLGSVTNILELLFVLSTGVLSCYACV